MDQKIYVATCTMSDVDPARSLVCVSWQESRARAACIADLTMLALQDPETSVFTARALELAWHPGHVPWISHGTPSDDAWKMVTYMITFASIR